MKVGLGSFLWEKYYHLDGFLYVLKCYYIFSFACYAEDVLVFVKHTQNN